MVSEIVSTMHRINSELTTATQAFSTAYPPDFVVARNSSSTLLSNKKTMVLENVHTLMPVNKQQDLTNKFAYSHYHCWECELHLS